MDTTHSVRAEIIDLDTVRRKRQSRKIRIAIDADDSEKLAKHMGFTRTLADSISLKEAYDIARNVAEAYSSKGALLQAFIERCKREPVICFIEFHQEMISKRKMTSAFTTDDLKALMALYRKNPSQYYETYVVAAAEEFLNRFRSEAEEA
jgi:hypothetical protein